MRLIDADALLDLLKFLANKKYNRELTTSYSNVYKECMGFVKCAPTIALHYVEIKRGHWVVDEDGNIKCSECGHCGVGDNYCERCGAKMDEVEDETD